MSIKSYRDLIAWQRAMDLAEAVHMVTSNFPREEMFCLTSQLRKSTVSIPSNIAEGQSRQTTRDFLNFLSIASGSLSEAETQLILAQRFRYFSDAQLQPLLEQAAEVGRLIHGLARSLRENQLDPTP